MFGIEKKLLAFSSIDVMKFDLRINSYDKLKKAYHLSRLQNSS
jgi:hypothetical protein